MKDDNNDNNSGSRRLGVVTATLIVVASMVGTGVFTTTGFLVRDLGSSFSIIVAWVIGGILALSGALTYGELVAALPRNGGEYQLLGRIYAPAVGFVAGWISLIVGFCAPIAAAAIAFGHYFCAVFPFSSPVVAGLILVLILSVLHGGWLLAGRSVQNLFTSIKILLIFVFIVCGMVAGDISQLIEGYTVPASDAILSPAFAVGLIYISFSYSGWNGASYIAGEVKNPSRTLPIALIGGTLLVTVLFVGLNLVFLISGPMARLSGVVEIGHAAAVSLFGQRAGAFLSGLIGLALISSVSAMIMAGPRVYEAMGQDYRRLSFLNRRTAQGGPITAVLLQCVIACAMMMSATFEALLTYIGFVLSLSAGLTALGVFVLRKKEPDLPRPYRVWGYPVTLILFLGLSLWMAVHAIVQRPVTAIAGIGTIGAGLLLYWILKGKTEASERKSNG